MFGGFQPTKSVIRKVTVTTPAKPAPKPTSTPKATVPARKATSLPTSRSSTPAATSKGANGSAKKHVRSDALVRKAVKRKAAEPLATQWDDSDDDDDSGVESDLSFDSARKRIRSSASSVEPSRIIADLSGRDQKDGGDFPLAHGADLVSGANALKFRPVFVEEIATEVQLQYPSISPRERFFLADSLESDGYKSMEDISETVKYICLNYLPPADVEKYASGGDLDFHRLLTRAQNTGSLPDYLATLDDFNKHISSAVENGIISRVLATRHTLNADWTKRILDQVYSRSVSPHVDLLREYKNGTDNVYGELLYPLVSEMFRETGLQADQTFVDLGSGVGNVVLQAALEIGCESWGCEMMRNPCDLADIQAEEFPQRARLWGLSVGQVRLLRGDFLENKEIGEVLKRADVVLVNNQAFGPDLNSKLVDRFLDLKEGCRVVSLKSFKPDGLELQERNVNDVRHLFTVRKLEYFSNRVSWTDAPGNYYIATKDSSVLRRFLEKKSRRK